MALSSTPLRDTTTWEAFRYPAVVTAARLSG